MIITDDLLRETFAAEAEKMTMPADTRNRVDAVVHRHRARRAATVAGGLVAAVGLAAAVPALLPDAGSTGLSAASAAATSYESWASRGALGADPDFAVAAADAWDAASPGAEHTDVHVLWADLFATGRGAVLVGTAGDGSRRLAVVAGGTPSLKVIRDIAAPQSLTHLSFNLFTDDEEHSVASYRDTLVVVTPPASGWTVEWSGGPDPSYGAGDAPTTDGIAVIDISQSGPEGHPRVRILDGTQVQYDGPIGSQN